MLIFEESNSAFLELDIKGFYSCLLLGLFREAVRYSEEKRMNILMKLRKN